MGTGCDKHIYFVLFYIISTCQGLSPKENSKIYCISQCLQQSSDPYECLTSIKAKCGYYPQLCKANTIDHAAVRTMYYDKTVICLQYKGKWH